MGQGPPQSVTDILLWVAWRVREEKASFRIVTVDFKVEGSLLRMSPAELSQWFSVHRSSGASIL